MRLGRGAVGVGCQMSGGCSLVGCLRLANTADTSFAKGVYGSKSRSETGMFVFKTESIASMGMVNGKL